MIGKEKTVAARRLKEDRTRTIPASLVLSVIAAGM
jgi:hypothetical protein